MPKEGPVREPWPDGDLDNGHAVLPAWSYRSRVKLFDYGTLSVVLAARPFGDALMVAVSLALAVETPPCVMRLRCAANPKESLHESL